MTFRGWSHKKQYRGGGDCLKGGGSWTVCRFNGEELGKKEGSGAFDSGGPRG